MKWYSKALETVIPDGLSYHSVWEAADRGNAEAQYRLGYMHATCCTCLQKAFLGSILDQMQFAQMLRAKLMRTSLSDAIGPVGPVSTEG